MPSIIIKKFRGIKNRFSIKQKRWTLGFLLSLISFGLFLPKPTHAIFGLSVTEMIGLGDIQSSILSWVMMVISTIISYLAGQLVAILAGTIEVVLSLNTQIINSTLVTTGFPIALSVANLGFTAAIIVIAVATILRFSNYGVKQILWKLIVAALLVNFSLVIAGSILNFFDQLSLYFLREVNPGVEGNSFGSFASSIAGAFNPQKAFLPEGVGGTGELTNEEIKQSSGWAAGDDFAKQLKPLAGLMFTVFAQVAIVITLATLVIMLLYRYVSLGILLILMPFAWLTWIFPNLEGNWNKWWHAFLKQATFAPVVIFFLYLGILVSSGMGQTNPEAGAVNLAAYANANDSILQEVGKSFGSNVLLFILETIILLGIFIGGLYASHHLSIYGAEAGMGAFKAFGGKVGDWTKGKVKEKGLRAANWGLNKTGLEEKTKSITERAQSNRLLRVLGVSKLLGKGAVGITQLKVAGGEGLVHDAAEKIKGDSTEVLNTKHITASGPEKIAIEQELMKRKELENLSVDKTHTDKNYNLYESYGMKKAFEKLEKATGMNLEMVKKMKAGAPKADIDAAAEAFYRKFDKADAALFHANELFKGEAKFGWSITELEEMGKSIAHGLATSAPQVTPNIISKMKSGNLERFAPLYRTELGDQIRVLGGTPATAPVTSRLNQLEKNLENFDKSMARNATGLGGGAGGTP